ncbi:putative lipoprotein [Anaplasma phagocytophilum str. ApNP]|uniref:Putative lipoprotein n=1 Tax=Anaplasma phagocytophilum str. ApNP TaxID=1359153 RepID=A0A0F3NHF9_ANAPH|nr:putative lipoprotein [Anaplasma phagocytophilum str. ApNP]
MRNLNSSMFFQSICCYLSLCKKSKTEVPEHKTDSRNRCFSVDL